MYAIRSYYACAVEDQFGQLLQTRMALFHRSAEFSYVAHVITSYSIHYTKLYDTATKRHLLATTLSPGQAHGTKMEAVVAVTQGQHIIVAGIEPGH